MVDNLEPGQPRRGRRVSFFRACCWFSGLSIGLLVCSGVYQGISTVHKGPTASAYYTGPLDDEHASEYLLPLIDRNQTFDIAATVWLRVPDAQKMAHNKEHVDLEGLEEDIIEEPLFSDIIFRGLKLTDKAVRTNISFLLPTERFRDTNITSTDLRGTFTLVPSSPSPFDYLSSYVDYREPSEKYDLPGLKDWPARAWPFPLGSQERERTLVDRAIDTMSATVPLVTFSRMRSRCGNEASQTKQLADSKADLEDMLDSLYQDQLQGLSSVSASKEKSDDEKWKRHPHIITRTQVRLMDETHPLSLEAFAKMNIALIKSPVCGYSSGTLQAVPWRRRCRRTYWTHGHWETRYLLKYPPSIPDGEPRYKTRYSPYLDTAPFPHGPKDMIPVPVVREKCVDSRNQTSQSKDEMPEILDADNLPVLWQVTFSRFSPSKDWATIMAQGLHQPMNYSWSDSELAHRQDQVEIIHGVLGHQYRDDVHPRRIFVLGFIRRLFTMLIFILDLHYWYSLKTTVGVSIPATMIYTGVLLLTDALIPFVMSLTKSWPDMGDLFALSVTSLSSVILTRALLRLDLKWHGWIPHIVRLPATHSERRSQRLDGATPLVVQIAFLGTAALFYLLSLDKQYMTPHLEVLSDEPLSPNLEALARLSYILQQTALLVTNVSQSELNRRSHTFAGSYRTGAFLTVLRDLVKLLGSLPVIIGKREAPNGISIIDIPQFVIAVLLARQAIILAPVGRVGQDDDEE